MVLPDARIGACPTDRRLRTTFDRAASQYQRARPAYPDALYADLRALTGIEPPARLLEVGCGPGKATLPLARMGFRITAVELGDALAAEARRNLAAFPGVSVTTSSFEEWEPPPGVLFDLVYAATAWKWVDPEVAYAKAAALLPRGGHLAVWAADHAFPAGSTRSSPRSRRCTTRSARATAPRGHRHRPRSSPTRPPPRSSPPATSRSRGHGATSGRCGTRQRTTRPAGNLLRPHRHGAGPPRTLFEEIRRRLAARADGRLTRHWSAVLTVGRRR